MVNNGCIRKNENREVRSSTSTILSSLLPWLNISFFMLLFLRMPISIPTQTLLPVPIQSQREGFLRAATVSFTWGKGNKDTQNVFQSDIFGDEKWLCFGNISVFISLLLFKLASVFFAQKAQAHHIWEHPDPNKPQSKNWKHFLPRIFHGKYFWLIFASSYGHFSVCLSDPLKGQAQVPRLRASIPMAAWYSQCACISTHPGCMHLA